MKALEWLEEELRVRFDLRLLSRDQEGEARRALLREWGEANQLRLLEKARDDDRKGQPNGLVYFVQEKITGAIKIGTSTQIEKRIRDLSLTLPTKVVMLATVAGSYRVEAWMHSRFETARIHGEWFRPVPELLEYIEAQK